MSFEYIVRDQSTLDILKASKREKVGINWIMSWSRQTVDDSDKYEKQSFY